MIHSKDNTKHYIWGNNCDSWVLKDTPGLSIKQEKMPSGTAEKLHFHKVASQFFYILKGKAVFYINNEKVSVNEGESFSILPHVQHFIANEETDDLEFLVISDPSTNNDRIEIEQ